MIRGSQEYSTENMPHAARSAGGATFEILGIGVLAVAMMGLLAFGYSTRTKNTETAGAVQPSIQSQTPTKQNMVSPMDRTEPPSSSTTGQGNSNGERVAPRQ